MEIETFENTVVHELVRPGFTTFVSLLLTLIVRYTHMMFVDQKLTSPIVCNMLAQRYTFCEISVLWLNTFLVQIRASSLSGECGILHEAFRGHFKLHGGHQDCVKRRATLSLQMNPACQVCTIPSYVMSYEVPTVSFLLSLQQRKQSNKRFRSVEMITVLSKSKVIE